MIFSLAFPESSCARPLISPLMDHNLVLASILAGCTPAIIYADDPHQPGAAFTWFKYRAFLAGNPTSPGYIEELADLLNDQLIPSARSAGIEACILDFDESEWVGTLPMLFLGIEPVKAQRQFYACRELPGLPVPDLPAGFKLTPVDDVLLSRQDLKLITELREETCSERVSVEDFLAHSFGYCIIHKDELVCWCLSEYNADGRCEVGVATAEPYQRRGLATIATHALLEHAFTLGYTQVGWHCWSRNQASGELALKTGFKLVKEHVVYLYTSLGA